MICMIWAQDKNGLIGKGGMLPWHLPNDLRFFKETTLNQTIVMGRTTFEGMNKRVLPNRQTIVLTRNHDYVADNVDVVHDIQDILTLAKTKDVYIVGGAQLYEQFAPYADVLIQTVIDATFEGDTYFPNISFDAFVLESEQQGVVDEKNRYPHTFKKYSRQKG
ncbi:dihydrofolate reductase [Carnobacteriaceae bacterium zg-ZUI252]|nr:dihydrofolate reductase [Carnobacteriaceae bacterium zg-ZUI252]MBS4769903.1 dihydrofolate reductase [Carnobacteriaceae bacterium zg-ZUI240]